MRVPGFFVSRIVLMSDGAATGLPATVVITSPAASPAESAGPSGTTPAISAPDVAGELPSTAPTDTPRNAVGPMWTPADLRPATICCAIPEAFAIRIANAAFDDAPSNRKRREPDAAVIIPTTRP